MRWLTIAAALVLVLTSCASINRADINREGATPGRAVSVPETPQPPTGSPASSSPSDLSDNREISVDQIQSLLTIAQLAIGLAGFTGIVSAVLAGADKKSQKAALRIRQLLDTSLGTAFYAFFPSILIPVAPSDEIAWRWSNAFLGIGHAVTLVISIRRARALGGAVVGEKGTLLQLMRMGGLVTIGLNGAAALNVVPWQTSVYLLGLLYLLLVASHTFVRLLLDNTD